MRPNAVGTAGFFATTPEFWMSLQATTSRKYARWLARRLSAQSSEPPPSLQP